MINFTAEHLEKALPGSNPQQPQCRKNTVTAPWTMGHPARAPKGTPGTSSQGKEELCPTVTLQEEEQSRFKHKQPSGIQVAHVKRKLGEESPQLSALLVLYHHGKKKKK